MNVLEQTSDFSTQRFLQVTKRFWVLNQKKWLIGFAGGAGILLIVFLLTSFQNFAASTPPPTSLAGVGVVTLGLILYKFGGYFLTSGIFNELGKKSSASQLLTLPASTLEKFLAGWFITYFLYSLVVLGLLYIIGIILGINPIIASQQLSDPLVSMTNVYFFDALLTFTAYHSLFFLGSIHFNGNYFIKTVLAIVISYITIGIISIILQIFHYETAIMIFFPSILGVGETTIFWSGTLIKLSITLLFLSLSYRQLQNRQVA